MICTGCGHVHRNSPHGFCWCGCTALDRREATEDEKQAEELISMFLEIPLATPFEEY